MPLTPKQRQLLDFVDAYIREHGYSPSYEEIAGRFGYRSLSTVSGHLQALAAKGVLRVEAGKPRSIEVLRLDARERRHTPVRPPREWLRERCEDFPVNPLPGGDGGELALVRRYRERWREIRGQLRGGDQLWSFCSPGEEWSSRSGRAGFAVVREGEVVDGILVWDGLRELRPSAHPATRDTHGWSECDEEP